MRTETIYCASGAVLINYGSGGGDDDNDDGFCRQHDKNSCIFSGWRSRFYRLHLLFSVYQVRRFSTSMCFCVLRRNRC